MNRVIILFIMLIWGLTWVFSKKISGFTEVSIIMFWRFFIAFLFQAFISVFNFKNFKLKKEMIFIITVNTFFIIIFNRFILLGLKQGGDSGRASIFVVVFSQIMTFIITSLINKRRLNKKEKLGLFFSVISLLFIFKFWDINFFFNIYNLYFFMAAIFWSLMTVFTSFLKTDLDIRIYTFYLYGIISFVELLLNLNNNLLSVFSLENEFWISLIFLSILSLSIASQGYFLISRKLGAKQSNSYFILVPIIVLIINFIFYRNLFELSIVLGALSSLFSLCFIIL